MSQETLPPIVEKFAREHPEVWDVYNKLGEAAAKAGPLDAKTERLVLVATGTILKQRYSTTRP